MSREQHTFDGLTAKQRAFVAGIAEGLTGVDAAKAADYQGTPSSLASIASRLLRHPRVRDALRGRGVSLDSRKGRPSSAGRPMTVVQPVVPADAPLTAAQGKALEVLLAGGNQVAAAKAAKVSPATVTKWMSITAFRAELDAQRLAALERARLRVEGLADEALDVATAVLTRAGRCAECAESIPAPSKEAQAMALAMLDRAGVGSRALDVPALRERMKGEAVGELADLLKSALPASVYRQVLAVVRADVVVSITEGSPA